MTRSITKKKRPDPPCIKLMNADHYPRIVAWEPGDELWIGYSPDLFIGGVCHGADKVKVFQKLDELIRAEVAERLESGRLPHSPRNAERLLGPVLRSHHD